MAVIMVRHGTTDLNHEGESAEANSVTLRGWLDIPLNKEGIEMASNAAQVLRGLPIYRLMCSDLVRTVQTAQEIAGVLKLPLTASPVFRPLNVGDMAGRPTAINKLHELVDDETKKAPGGESFRNFLDRFLPAIIPLVKSKHLFVVVAHSRNIMVLEGLCKGKGKLIDAKTLKSPCSVAPSGMLIVYDWDKWEVFNPTTPPIKHPARLDKQSVLYMHVVGEDKYDCDDCHHYLRDIKRCTILGKDDVIEPYGACGLWSPGGSQLLKDVHPPRGVLTKEQVGYIEHKAGYSCKRCEYFISERKDCQKVDPESKGDDPGFISPNACCNAWEEK